MEGMTMYSDAGSSIVSLDIGGKKFRTTVDTLTQREPHSMLAAMFSGCHAVRKDSKKECVFIDRDGKHFRHILNWLRDGVALIPNMSDLERLELLREAEYYQLLGLVDKINEVLNRKEDLEMKSDLTRAGIIKCIQAKNVKLRGVNLSGLDLSKLNLTGVDLSYACLKNVNFSDACLMSCNFQGADLRFANLQGANLSNAYFRDANIQCADFRRTDLADARSRWALIN